MSKGNRQKYRSPELARQSKKILPDDYYSFGPLEFARFGKHVLTRNNQTEEQHHKLTEIAAKHFPLVCQEIDNQIERITELMLCLPAAEVLKRAHWEFAGITIQPEKNDAESASALRLIEYLQSVISSINCPAGIPAEDIPENTWMQLKEAVEILFQKINTEYVICCSAKQKKENNSYNYNLDEFSVRALLHWCNVRGDRFYAHETIFYRAVLEPHDKVLRELFDISSNDLVNALDKLLKALTSGLANLAADLRNFQERVMSKISEKLQHGNEYSELDTPQLMDQVITENGWQERKKDVFDRLTGLALFDVSKITGLPNPFLQELSWGIGENSSFFEGSNFRGWPTKIWPVFERPFIKLGNTYCCFELHNLFDHLYRVLQRAIILKKPEYSVEWKEKQTEVSERLPLTLLKKILPDSKTLRSVYYGSKKQRMEVDGLILCEDHLIVIEVKSGAFTYTSPVTDIDAHIASLKDLVSKPSQQGRRFLEYLTENANIKLYDSKNNIVGALNSQEFSHKTICCVTLDSFTALAAQVQHLQKIGIDVGETPVWQISISDLFVYADLFKNPLIFLHYIEQRNLAFKSDILQLHDEIDHIGMYLKHNAYALYAQELFLGEKSKHVFHGYGQDIDAFYAQKVNDSGAACELRQELPFRMNEITSFLASHPVPHRRFICSLLLDCSGDWREQISSGIDRVLRQQKDIPRAQPLAICGAGMDLTIFCWQEGSVESDDKLARDHTLASMLVTKDSTRFLLELFFDKTDRLQNIHSETFHQTDIKNSERASLQALSDSLKRRRIEKAKTVEGKIGRNAPCPCGSGKKFKYCCG